MIRKKAFTLTEILIAVILLAIIAGFMIPNYKSQVKRAEVGSIVRAMETIHASNQLFRSRSNTDQYLTGSGLNIDVINTNLGVSIPDLGFNYAYDSSNGKSYNFVVEKAVGDAFKMMLNESLFNAAVNPCCCSAGQCSRLPTCGTSCP